MIFSQWLFIYSTGHFCLVVFKKSSGERKKLAGGAVGSVDRRSSRAASLSESTSSRRSAPVGTVGLDASRVVARVVPVRSFSLKCTGAQARAVHALVDGRRRLH